MKSIIYAILAIFILGMVATGFTSKPETKYRIVIQSAEGKISPSNLSRSAEIITNRLKSFSNEKFEVSAIAGKNQIQVTLNKHWDMKIARNLLTQKGSIAFYETYNYQGVSELLKDDSMLLSLFNSKAPSASTSQIGCITDSEVSKVDKYLYSLGLDQKCRFVWSNPFDETNICLYALKLEKGKNPIAVGNDIDNYKTGYDSNSKQDFINFSFKKPAIPLWAEITKRNIGSAIAILLDGKVIFAPVVQDEISGGNCWLTGGFTTSHLKYIVAIGSNGELPVSFVAIE